MQKLSVEVERVLKAVEAGIDLAPKGAGYVAMRCAHFEITSNEVDVEQLHTRVQEALDKLGARQALDNSLENTLRRLKHPERVPYFEEDMQLTGFFEKIGALLFFDVDHDEARIIELLNAFGALLEQRRRRGQIKEAFLQSYRTEMSRLIRLPVLSKMICMMELEHLVEKAPPAD